MDFTLHAYRQLCEKCAGGGRTLATFRDFLETKGQREGILVMRHDVDRRHNMAVKMAKLEQGLGFQSTYYFRSSASGRFDSAAVAEVATLGHEIGFHYESLARARGDIAEALRLFDRDLASLRAIARVDTICMHGSPLSSFDNRSLWSDPALLASRGLIGEPYLSVDYSRTLYFSDTGRSWDPGRQANIRDHVGAKIETASFNDSSSLAGFLAADKRPAIILTHPERWASNMLELSISICSDSAANSIKRVARKLRR